MGITLLAVSEWLTPLLARASSPLRALHGPGRRAAPWPTSHPSLVLNAPGSANPLAMHGQKTVELSRIPSANPSRGAVCYSPRPQRANGQALRLVRLTEVGQQPGYAGRMAISGRMADVCAELDRLERLERQREKLH